MGQRHQIFVKVLNPVYVLGKSKDKVTPAMKKMFGTDQFTILAFHNQDLYGRSALQLALNMLNFSAQFEKDLKTGGEKWDGYNSPLCYKGISMNFADVDQWVSAIQHIINYRPVATPWLTAGFWRNHFLNKPEPEMRDDFRRGDNNDGITIIDTIENKYCFMNIYNQEPDQYNVSELPTLVPCTAAQYVRAYYGETVETINPYYLEPERLKANNTTAAKSVAKNKELNAGLISLFEPYQLLTVEEVAAMFPKIKDKILKAQPAYE